MQKTGKELGQESSSFLILVNLGNTVLQEFLFLNLIFNKNSDSSESSNLM